jgi:hypothetical protein
LNDSFGGLRSFLGQIVPDAARDGPVRIFALGSGDGDGRSAEKAAMMIDIFKLLDLIHGESPSFDRWFESAASSEG